jgi:hypothetical protein
MQANGNLHSQAGPSGYGVLLQFLIENLCQPRPGQRDPFLGKVMGCRLVSHNQCERPCSSADGRGFVSTLLGSVEAFLDPSLTLRSSTALSGAFGNVIIAFSAVEGASPPPSTPSQKRGYNCEHQDDDLLGSAYDS